MLLNVSEMTLAGVEMTFLQSQSGEKKTISVHHVLDNQAEAR